METKDIIETLNLAANSQHNIALGMLLRFAAERLEELDGERNADRRIEKK